MKKFTDVYTNLNSLTLLITNKCNLSCSYCFEKNKGNSNMPPEMALDIIKSSYKAIDPSMGKFTINLFGGEPLMNWETIKAILDYIGENDLKALVTMTTNLTLLTDEMLDYFDEYSMPILVSIDGTKDVHDKHRCGSFDTVIANMKKMIDRGLHNFIEARMTITPETVSGMYDSVKMLIDMGINSICPMPASDLDWDDKSIEEFKKQYTKVLQLYVDIMNDENCRRNLSIRRVDESIQDVLEETFAIKTMCNIANPRWCIVDWNGDVWPCPDYPMTDCQDLLEGKLGNFYTGINEELVSEEAMDATFELDRCEGCKAKCICQSGCPYQNYTTSGSFKTPTESYCKLENAYFEALVDFRDKLVNATNIRSRHLNIVIENIKVKKYFDERLKTIDIFHRDFQLRLDHFVELYENLNANGNVLSKFDDYFKRQLATVLAVLNGLNGYSLEYKEDTPCQQELQEDKK